MTTYRVTRDVTPDECYWLGQTVPKGTTVYRCTRPTYGVVSPRGVAVTHESDGGYPFFELPLDAVQAVEDAA